MNNKIEDILGKVGLTNRESRTYLALLRLQEAQSGKICKETNIASSNIYKILDSLLKKGLVNYRIHNNIRIFMPAPAETLNELFLVKQRKLEQERKEINEVIENLKVKDIEKESFSKYKYFEGFIGIKSMWYEINNYMNSSMLLRIHTSRREGYERLVGFYNEHHKLRLKKHVKERLIFPKGEENLAKKRKNKYTEIKFSDLKEEVEWGVIGDFYFMQYITGKVPRGFLIKDKKFSRGYEEVFDNLWEVAKK